jgi:hypothetical protein
MRTSISQPKSTAALDDCPESERMWIIGQDSHAINHR